MNHLNVELELWKAKLGLLPVPLTGKSGLQHSVLMNGSTGNFCLSFEEPLEDPLSTAWSSNVGHYVSLVGGSAKVHRWDRPQPAEYKLEQVRRDLALFHKHLEADEPTGQKTIVAHALGVFRALRNHPPLREANDGRRALDIFLVLLAAATQRCEPGEVELAGWDPDGHIKAYADQLDNSFWDRLVTELRGDFRLQSLVPDYKLLLRHASGALFEEAHREAEFTDQMSLFSLPEAKVRAGSKGGGARGVLFTPAPIVRSLVEEALVRLAPSETVTVLDPACGSGEFLLEVLRQTSAPGNCCRLIKLIGRDISGTAVDMARFVLTNGRKDHPLEVEIQVTHGDSLTWDWPQADIVLMNPPFGSWGDLSEEEREAVVGGLGSFAQQRPDLASLFLLRAVRCLRPAGVAAAVLPSSVLGGTSSASLIRELRNRIHPSLIARLGSHRLFERALVDTSLLVAGADPSDEVLSEGTTVLWSDHRPSSGAAGLRALRRRRYDLSLATPYASLDSYSLYTTHLDDASTDWTARPYRALKLVQDLVTCQRADSLFSIRQGARTGNNDVFLLSEEEFGRLPKTERVYFRPAVVNASIRAGRLGPGNHLFYPYSEDGEQIGSEVELEQKLPVFFQRYLEPARKQLSGRPSRRNTPWFLLSEPRAWQRSTKPRLFSTYFGKAGSWAWDESGSYVVVQGFAWEPLPGIVSGSSLSWRDVGPAYSVLMSSDLIDQLLPAISNNLAGGQFDLSPRFVGALPLPDLFNADESVISALTDAWRLQRDPKTDPEVRALVYETFGALHTHGS